MSLPDAADSNTRSTGDHWPTLPGLVDHIIKTHHHYVRGEIPMLTRELHILVNGRGLERPELAEIERTFVILGHELLAHLDKEECILFPYICELAAADLSHSVRPLSPFGTIANPLRMMELEHQEAIEHLEALRDLTKEYTPPSAWSPIEAGVYLLLAMFDADFQRHVELENSLLFPRALDLESRLA